MPTPIATIPTRPGRLAAALLALLAAGILAAPAALAVEDLSRPTAKVTQGPSCHPGGVVVEVTAGTAPYTVVLATTRHPEGEDSALLAPGQTVQLRSGEVDWGETIDSRLEYAAQDGSGVAYTDELEPFTFTRPSQADCAAIGATASGAPATVPTPMVVPDAPGAGLDPAPDAQGSPDAEGAPDAQGSPDAEGVPATGADPSGSAAEGTDTPAVVPAGGGVDLQFRSTAADRPAAPVTRSFTWPAVLAGAALLASTGGLLVTGLRRRAGARRGAPPTSA